MTEADLQAREELFEDAPTGVEVEQLESDREGQPTIERPPWNPEHIRVSTKNFSIRNILDLIKDHDLELAPDFQRNRVWKSQQKSRLIESIILQIPLPAFYFAEDDEGMMRVVDGLQRLSTVADFVGDGTAETFPLTGLEYLNNVKGTASFQLRGDAEYTTRKLFACNRPDDTCGRQVRHIQAYQYRRIPTEQSGNSTLHEQETQPRFPEILYTPARIRPSYRRHTAGPRTHE